MISEHAHEYMIASARSRAFGYLDGEASGSAVPRERASLDGLVRTHAATLRDAALKAEVLADLIEREIWEDHAVALALSLAADLRGLASI